MPTREQREAMLNAPDMRDYRWVADVGDCLWGSLYKAEGITANTGSAGVRLWIRNEDQPDEVWAFDLYGFNSTNFAKANMVAEQEDAAGESIPFTGDYIDVKCTKVKDENNKYPEYKYTFSHREATDEKPSGAMMDDDGIINLDDPNAETQF